MYERLNVSTRDAHLSSDLPPANTNPPITSRTWIMAFLFQFSKENARETAGENQIYLRVTGLFLVSVRPTHLEST